MIVYLYKRYLALYMGLALSTFFGSFIFFNTAYPARNSFEELTRAIFLLVLSILFSLFICFSLATKKNQQEIALLTEKCDPYAFLEALAKIKPGRKDLRPYILLNMAAGYANTPDWRMNQQILQDVLTCTNKPSPPVYLALYYNNLADFYLKSGQYPLSVQALQNMEGQLNEPKFPKNLYYQYYNLHLDMVFLLNLAQGQLDGVETVLLARFNRLKEKSGKVNTQLHLAMLYRQTGETEKQRQALAFVLQNGNKLFAVQEAGQMLAELDGAAPLPGQVF